MGKPLNAKLVASAAKPGRYYDVGLPGFCLTVTKSGGKSWALRFQKDRHQQTLGLGSVRDFSLAEAREKARMARKQLAEGVNPVDARKAAKEARRLAEARTMTFQQAADAYYAQHSAGWKSNVHRQQFVNTLATYAHPILSTMNIADITTPDVLRVLKPIWAKKHETAKRVRGRIEAILGWATVEGYRAGDNPARWEKHLSEALPKRNGAKKSHARLEAEKVPAFMETLRTQQGSAARCLEFVILTGVRTSEATGAVWSEIDLQARTWTVPASRMKKGREHCVPLSEPALALLRTLPREEGNPHLFVGMKKGQPLSNMAMLVLLKRMKFSHITVHGFRSTFRDWAEEVAGFSFEVCEAAIAHVRGDATVRAYVRGTLFEQRKSLMTAWAAYCDGRDAAGNVVQMRA